MHATAIRFALLGAAAILAGCASTVPADVAWQHQSTMDQHRYMPNPAATTVAQGASNTAVMGAAAAVPPPMATRAVQQGDTVMLVSDAEYARLQGSNPQVLGAPPAQPAAPATK